MERESRHVTGTLVSLRGVKSLLPFQYKVVEGFRERLHFSLPARLGSGGWFSKNLSFQKERGYIETERTDNCAERRSDEDEMEGSTVRTDCSRASVTRSAE